MKKTVLSLFMLCAIAYCYNTSFAQIQTPRPSPSGSVSSQVGLTDVTVDYFRPKVKGRKIFGNGSDYLVPFGEMWRTGANSGTKLTISDEIKIEGKKVAAGEYLILTIPNQNEWTIILYSDPSLGGNVVAYNETKATGKFTVKPTSLAQAVETLTINIADISEDNTSASLEIAWENVSVKLPFQVEYDSKVMKAIKANTKVSPSNYLAAARYYFNTDRDLNQALQWIDIYLAEKPNQFWNVHLKAQMLKAKGDKKAAMATAEKSLELAKNAPSDFGYIKRNEDLIASLK